MRGVVQRSELQAKELQTLTEEKRVLLEYAVAMQRKVRSIAPTRHLRRLNGTEPLKHAPASKPGICYGRALPGMGHKHDAQGYSA